MSTLFKIVWKDWARGLFFAASGAAIGVLISMLENHGHLDWHIIENAALIGGLTYLKSKFFTDTEGKVLGKF